jgi:hypothetical protein
MSIIYHGGDQKLLYHQPLGDWIDVPEDQRRIALSQSENTIVFLLVIVKSISATVHDEKRRWTLPVPSL